MANGKKSFITYLDWRGVFEALPDDKAGQLIKHIFSYVSDENPESPDVLINVAFAGIKADLKRDLKKWEEYIQKQSLNGKKGGRPKKTQKTQPFFEKPKKTDNVNVNVNDNVNDSNILLLRSDFFDTCLKDETYLNSFISRYNLDHRGIKMMIKDFNSHLDARKDDQPQREYDDWCRYFDNWVLRSKTKNRRFFDKYR